MRVGRYADITPARGSAFEASAPTDMVKAPEDLTTDELRQGVTGHGVRYVLAISLGTALIALAIVWALVV